MTVEQIDELTSLILEELEIEPPLSKIEEIKEILGSQQEREEKIDSICDVLGIAIMKQRRIISLNLNLNEY